MTRKQEICQNQQSWLINITWYYKEIFLISNCSNYSQWYFLKKLIIQKKEVFAFQENSQSFFNIFPPGGLLSFPNYWRDCNGASYRNKTILYKEYEYFMLFLGGLETNCLVTFGHSFCYYIFAYWEIPIEYHIRDHKWNYNETERGIW